MILFKFNRVLHDLYNTSMFLLVHFAEIIILPWFYLTLCGNYDTVMICYRPVWGYTLTHLPVSGISQDLGLNIYSTDTALVKVVNDMLLALIKVTSSCWC